MKTPPGYVPSELVSLPDRLENLMRLICLSGKSVDRSFDAAPLDGSLFALNRVRGKTNFACRFNAIIPAGRTAQK
jgi:hypothetical protein